METLKIEGRHSGHGQTFDFTEVSMDMVEEPGLATAFAVSLRSTQPEIPSADEHIEGVDTGLGLGDGSASNMYFIPPTQSHSRVRKPFECKRPTDYSPSGLSLPSNTQTQSWSTLTPGSSSISCL